MRKRLLMGVGGKANPSPGPLMQEGSRVGSFILLPVFYPSVASFVSPIEVNGDGEESLPKINRNLKTKVNLKVVRYESNKSE